MPVYVASIGYMITAFQVLECYALNEAPPEEIEDLTKPDIEGMSKQADKILAFRVSGFPLMLLS